MSTDLDRSGRFSWPARLTESLMTLLRQCSPHSPITSQNQPWSICAGHRALGRSSCTYGRFYPSKSRSNNTNNGERS